MAAMTTVAPVCLRSSAHRAQVRLGRVVAPAALRRSAVSAGRRASGLTVRLRPSPAFRFVPPTHLPVDDSPRAPSAPDLRAIARVVVSTISGRIGAGWLTPRPPSSVRLSFLRVRADAMKDAMDKYNEITYKIPPIVTAAAVPVVGLSLLCKTVPAMVSPATCSAPSRASLGSWFPSAPAPSPLASPTSARRATSARL